MTGFDIYNDVMQLLGYTDEKADIVPDRATEKRVMAAINYIVLDLGGNVQITKLGQFVTDNLKQKEAIVYGVAMFLSLFDNDTHGNVIYTAIYNAKRASFKSRTLTVRDVLPQPEGIV